MGVSALNWITMIFRTVQLLYHSCSVTYYLLVLVGAIVYQYVSFHFILDKNIGYEISNFESKRFNDTHTLRSRR